MRARQQEPRNEHDLPCVSRQGLDLAANEAAGEGLGGGRPEIGENNELQGGSRYPVGYRAPVQPQSLASESERADALRAADIAGRIPIWSSQPGATIIRPSRSLFDLGLRSLWPYRELLFYLTWRDIKVRYKQTVVGVAWVLLQPIATTVIFTIIFSKLAHLQAPNHIPYVLFVFAGLLPWQLFASGMAGVTASVVGNTALITKVYFPRLIIPVASVLSAVVDFAMGLVVLAFLMIHYHYSPGIHALAIPFFILVAILTALAAGLWLAILNVRYRDVQYTIPFLTQAWLLLTPVAYSSSIVPVRYRALMGVNPMTSVVNGFRWAFVGGPAPWSHSFAASLAMVGFLLVTGVIFFRRTEKTFADLI